MESRLRKLTSDKSRLNKQIATANKHSEFATSIKERRHSDTFGRNVRLAQEQQAQREQEERNNYQK